MPFSFTFSKNFNSSAIAHIQRPDSVIQGLQTDFVDMDRLLFLGTNHHYFHNISITVLRFLEHLEGQLSNMFWLQSNIAALESAAAVLLLKDWCLSDLLGNHMTTAVDNIHELGQGKWLRCRHREPASSQ